MKKVAKAMWAYVLPRPTRVYAPAVPVAIKPLPDLPEVVVMLDAFPRPPVRFVLPEPRAKPRRAALLRATRLSMVAESGPTIPPRRPGSSLPKNWPQSGPVWPGERC